MVIATKAKDCAQVRSRSARGAKVTVRGRTAASTGKKVATGKAVDAAKKGVATRSRSRAIWGEDDDFMKTRRSSKSVSRSRRRRRRGKGKKSKGRKGRRRRGRRGRKGRKGKKGRGRRRRGRRGRKGRKGKKRGGRRRRSRRRGGKKRR